jgi:AcrR family transcriptional regulator
VSRPHRTGSTRDRIAAAALELLATQDFAATSVDDIARQAGVAKGTVFYQYGSKDALYAEIAHRGVSALADELRAAADTAWPDGGEEILRVILAYVARYPAFTKVLLIEAWRDNDAWAPAVRLLREQVIGVITAAIGRARQRGEVAADVDPETAGPTLFWAAAVTGVDWIANHPDADLANLQALLAGLIRRAGVG